jgi:hypothetical protein
MGIIITYYINAMYFNVQYDSGDEGKKIYHTCGAPDFIHGIQRA